METEWLDETEREAWLRLVAVVELLPGVLDAQLRAEARLTHFEYFVLAMHSEAPERTLRMTSLALRTNATLPRLSHVVRRLECRGLVERFPCPEDGRATDARLTDAGWDAMLAAAPGHVTTVRRTVLDPLTASRWRSCETSVVSTRSYIGWSRSTGRNDLATAHDRFAAKWSARRHAILQQALRRGDPQGAVLDERDRVRDRPQPASGHRSRQLPDRAGSTQDVYLVTRSLDPKGTGQARWSPGGSGPLTSGFRVPSGEHGA